MRGAKKLPLFLGITVLAAVLLFAGLQLIQSQQNTAATLNVVLVDEYGNTRSNFSTPASPLAVIFQSPLPGGGTTPVEIRSRDEFWVQPVVKISLEKHTAQPVNFAVKLKINSINVTWGGQPVATQHFASTTMEKTFTYTSAGNYDLSGAGNVKIPCSSLLADPPTQATPNKQLRIAYSITLELYSGSVLISSQTVTPSAMLNFEYRPDGALSIVNVNIQPVWVQVI